MSLGGACGFVVSTVDVEAHDWKDLAHVGLLVLTKAPFEKLLTPAIFIWEGWR